jgi:hypothetical protein
MAAEPTGGAVALPEALARPAARSGSRRLPVIPLGIIAVFVLVGLLAPS